MMRHLYPIAFLVILCLAVCESFVQWPTSTKCFRNLELRATHSSRRSFISLPFILCGTSFFPHQTQALDIDAFIQQEIASEKPKGKMSDDEALCKFGMVGKLRGDACKRLGISTAAKTPGGVDAYGNIDRGTFERCRRSWSIVNGKYEKEDICE